MAWIESHQKLRLEPKLFNLVAELGCGKAEGVGLLHMFWWWCVDHAENGDLSSYNNTHLSMAVELNHIEGKRFVDALVNAGFVEREPYFRVSNWWKFAGRFMKQRYKDNPSKWKAIEMAYANTVTVAVSVPVTATQATNQPNQPNKPNPTAQPHLNGDAFGLFWKAYPRHRAKGQAERAWKKIKPSDEILSQMLASIEKSKTSEGWSKDDGKFIPYPATWLNGRRWEDEIDGGTAKDWMY